MAKVGPLIVEPISETRPVIVLPPVSSLVPPWLDWVSPACCQSASKIGSDSILMRFDPTVRSVSKGSAVVATGITLTPCGLIIERIEAGLGTRVIIAQPSQLRKQKRPVGRPSSYHRDYCAKIIKAMATGLSAEATTANVGIPARQIDDRPPRA
jgi:hypothetical protein